MSGHSKWSQIKRQKGVNDAKRGNLFTKLANAITIIAKESGNGDPASNPRLRVAVDTARNVNMPKENIQRAIDRGLGKLPGQTIEGVIYEGFGPGQVAFLLEGVTDNKMRTTSEVRNIFERNGGSMGNTAYMFERVGEIKVEGKGSDKDGEILELIDLGAGDVEDYSAEDRLYYLVYTESSELNTMSNKITQSGYVVESAQLVYRPKVSTEVNDKEKAQKVLDLAEKLEEHDDIQRVYSNLETPENLS